MIDGKDVVESLKSPRIISLSFFSEKTEGMIVSRQPGDMEEWHLVFVGFVGAVEEKDGMVGGKELEGGRMTEK